MTDRTEALGTQKPAEFVAFAGDTRLAAGELCYVAGAVRGALDATPGILPLVFRRETGEIVDLDLRGSVQDVTTRYSKSKSIAPKRGRPKLGVVAREVTLLPRHWDWLALQPGGASTTLRRLVEAAQKSTASAARARTEAAYKFMLAVAGDRPGFEDATRALFAGDHQKFREIVSRWPDDIADEALGQVDKEQVGGGESE
jgi:hypothetical protein